MKKLFTVLNLFLLIGFSNAQQASDYFPTQAGFEWKFKAIPLDSASNPINALAYYRIDRFESVANYEGKNANIVQTKSGLLDSIIFQPYQDSLYYSTEGTNGYEYFSIKNIEGYLTILNTIVPSFNFVDFFTSLQDWYPLYQFASPIGDEYTLRQIDTTIFIDPVGNVPVRFRYFGTRLDDQTIPTVLGNFDCKKFVIQWNVKAYTVFDIITLSDTIWIAPDNWIVQDIIPGQYVDISILPIDPFSLLGLETKLTDEIVSVENEESIPTEFSLEQNYPNPFNPSTKIRYTIPSVIASGTTQSQLVILKIYDVLGNEIATLVNEEKSAGTYEIEFDSHSGSVRNLTSGVYFYKLQAGSFVDTKKMILLK